MELLDALLVLKEQAVEGVIKYPYQGICSNLLELTNRADLSYLFVEDNCEDWEHFSGNSAYPVVMSDDCGLWEGEQLKLRLSLLDHLIDKAKQQSKHDDN